ncbi:MAG: ATP-binding protein [Candidatus Pacearchaeota archaeon]|jgi:predicted AAA+ superfamily ATPase
MDEQKLASALSSMNVWWGGMPVPTSLKKAETKRKVFYDLSKNCLKDKEICCISGPRQVGKTTLMGQLIEHQIKEVNIDAKRIIYIQIDSELIKLNCDNILIDSLKVYFDYILGESPEKLKSKVYVYLDEIQSLENWAKQIKSYEIFPNLKFIISGSSQTKLYADSSESLVGRIQFRLVLPFKFREFLEFSLKDEKLSPSFEFSSQNLREALKNSINTNNPEFFFKKLSSIQIGLTSDLPKIKKCLNSYLIKGGYPGALEYGENYTKALEKIRTDLELTVYKDIHKMFNTRNSSDLMSLLVLMANSSGQKINYSKLSSTIGIDRRVVTDYLNYTALLYLTLESPIYKNSKYRQIEKMNKAYLVDVGHRNALLGKMNEEILNESDSGLLIQTAVFNHASRLRFYLSKYTEHEIFYWEDGTNEVDLILDLPVLVLPLEVKSRSGNKAVGAIKRFLAEHNKSKWGIIITLDELKLEDNILFMPLWAFLLMC